MALQRGPFGSGYIKKLGQTVGFKAGGGEYGIRTYQPDVTNPRTASQTSQRARFNWCAKMAAVLGNDALVGLSNERQRTVRQAFSAININRVQMDALTNPEQVDAFMSAMAMRLSMGSVVTGAPILTSGGHNILNIVPESFYGQEAERPDELLVAVVVVDRLADDGYRAAWVRIPYTTFENGVASAPGQKLQVTPEISTQAGFQQECVVYFYNVKYNGNSVRYRYGRVQPGRVHEDIVFGTTDTMKRLSRGDQYSMTLASYVTLINQ